MFDKLPNVSANIREYWYKGVVQIGEWKPNSIKNTETLPQNKNWIFTYTGLSWVRIKYKIVDIDYRHQIKIWLLYIKFVIISILGFFLEIEWHFLGKTLTIFYS